MLSASSAPSLGSMRQKGNPGNSPLCHSLGPIVLASLSLSLHLPECSYVYAIYNVQEFWLHLAEGIKQKVLLLLHLPRSRSPCSLALIASLSQHPLLPKIASSFHTRFLTSTNGPIYFSHSYKEVEDKLKPNNFMRRGDVKEFEDLCP